VSGEDIARRYSKALFQLSKEKSDLQRRKFALKLIADLFNRHKRLATFFRLSHVPVVTKKNILQSALKDVEDETLIAFLCLLLDKRRFIYLLEIVRCYEEMADEEMGLLEGTLKTAYPLEQSMMDKMRMALEKKFNKNVVLKEKICPKAIGGGMLFIDNKYVDFSLRGKLQKLKTHLFEGSL